MDTLLEDLKVSFVINLFQTGFSFNSEVCIAYYSSFICSFLCVCVCLSLSLSLSLCVCLFLSLSLSPSISISLSVSVSLSRSLALSLSLFRFLSLCHCIYGLSLYLSSLALSQSMYIYAYVCVLSCHFCLFPSFSLFVSSYMLGSCASSLLAHICMCNRRKRGIPLISRTG